MRDLFNGGDDEEQEQEAAATDREVEGERGGGDGEEGFLVDEDAGADWVDLDLVAAFEELSAGRGFVTLQVL